MVDCIHESSNPDRFPFFMVYTQRALQSKAFPWHEYSERKKHNGMYRQPPDAG
jgi:hypothetical protein